MRTNETERISTERKTRRRRLLNRNYIRRLLSVEALDRRVMLAVDFATAFDSPLLGANGVSQEVHQLATIRTQVSLELTRLFEATSGGQDLSDAALSAYELLMVDDQSQVQIHVSGEQLDERLDELVAAGFEPLYVSLDHQMADGLLPISAIPDLQSVVEGFSVGVRPNWRPMTSTGSVKSEADVVMQSARVRNSLPAGYDGTGTRVGIISDSFNSLNGYAGDIATGDLPSGVTVVLDLGSGGTDEGRAMAQLVHDLAPGAALGFATAFVGGQAGFAANIQVLADSFNADVIVDDVFYFAEPFFQDGIIAQAIDSVVSNNGVAYFSAAGNLQDQSFELTEATSLGSTTINFPGGGGDVTLTSALDLNPGPGADFRQSVTLEPGQQLILGLQWDDPFYATVTSDIDVFLVDQASNTVVSFGIADNIANDEPFDFINFTNVTGATRTYEIVLDLFTGPIPERIKWVNFGANATGPLATIEYDTNSPTITPHAATPNAMAVGAVPYFDQEVPESFTSLGPSTILFSAVGDPITPEVRLKPDIAAIDGTNNTFFGQDFESDGSPNFFGTSAAAPHAAAVAALMLQANSSLTPAQLYAAMQSSARDVGAPGFDLLTGAGLVNAHAAVFGSAVPATLPIVENLESGALNTAWETNSQGNGRIEVRTGNSPAAGYNHLVMDTFFSSTNSLNEATLHFDAIGASNVVLSFQQREFGDEDHPMPETFTGRNNSDGVALSVDGLTWHRLVSLTGTDSVGSYRVHRFNLSEFATSKGLVLGDDVRIKFQQFDNFPLISDGMVFDNIEVTAETATPAAWQAQGPFSATNGQTENVAPNNNISGALHTVIAHPTDADILYVGSVNGGVWKTSNARAPLPDWSPLTDDMPSQSIGALAFDIGDESSNTIYAGTGRYSSFAQIGNQRVGLLRSTNGGASFEVVDGGGILVGKNISGIYANDDVIVVSVNVADSFTFENIGIFRSTDGGATFTQISQGNGTATGLPGGTSYDLVTDPVNVGTLYTSTVFSNFVGGQNGVYKSTDAGETWSRVSDPVMEALITGDTSNIELAVGRSNNLFAAIINTGRLDGLFRSGDGGSSWTQLDTPTTNENGTDVGLNPGGGKGPGPGSEPGAIAGGQGAIHFSIVADPNDPNIVYVGGDRQPLEFQFPTSIGAIDYSGRLFRGDASQPAGSQFVHLTHSNELGAAGGGTASISSPHADSREMVFDADGNIIEVDDGGVYRRTDPQSNMGDWFSLNGNLQVTEAHDVAWDSVSHTAITANQDTGTTYQPYAGATTWVSLSTADGGDVLVDDVSLADIGRSIRYSSFQNLGAFRRTTWDANGNLLSTEFPALSVTSGSPLAQSFITKLSLNAIAPVRLIVQGSNSTYESFDRGDTLIEVGAGVGAGWIEQNAIAYGGRKEGVENADVLWVGSNSDIFFRSAPGGLAAVSADPTTDDIRDLAIDPDDWATAFVIDRNQVFATSTQGNEWLDVTGDLLSLASDLRSIEFIAGTVVDALVVGTNRGVFAASLDALGTWLPLAPDLPNVLVYDMEYDSFDDLLIAGTFGRGAWTLGQVSGIVEALFAGDVIPPTVSSVIAGSSVWSSGFIDTIDGGGAGTGNGLGLQLAVGNQPLPWNNVDRLYVQFSEAVAGVSTATFELRSSVGVVPVSVSYDPVTFMATVELSTPLSFNKFRLSIADSLTDTIGNPLDGDLAGGAGGIFNFRFDVLPGDANGDGRVNGADLTPFSAAFNSQVGQANFAPFANWNGDIRVNGADLAVFSAFFNQRIDSLSDPGAPFGGSGSSERLSINRLSAARRPQDAFFAMLDRRIEDEEDDESGDDAKWDALIASVL